MLSCVARQERLFALHKTSKSDEEKLRAELEEKRHDAEMRASEVRQKASSMRSRYEEMLKQEERDNDQEFALQRAAQQRALMQEREVAQTLKGETAILRKKFEAFQNDMEDMRNTLRARERDIKQLQVSHKCPVCVYALKRPQATRARMSCAA